MDAWDLATIDAARAAEGRLYEEFLRVPDLSAGLYVLDAGATDPQSPHSEDELYYVVAGRGAVTVGDETRDVGAGSLVFGPAEGARR
jgi:mannose-6-phosphate isomerase-like protein (cupin superfamily)